jgi:hypothetical protein
VDSAALLEQGRAQGLVLAGYRCGAALIAGLQGATVQGEGRARWPSPIWARPALAARTGPGPALAPRWPPRARRARGCGMNRTVMPFLRGQRAVRHAGHGAGERRCRAAAGLGRQRDPQWRLGRPGRLAARLAREGIPVFRFDRRGVGDSSGANPASAPARPISPRR